MTARVRITDVSPRDGLQNESGVIPTADKLRLVEALCATGVDEVEVTSFVSRRAIPQLGDAGELMALVREFAESVGQVSGVLSRGQGTGHGTHLPRFSVLVPNEKGMDRALEFHSTRFPVHIALFTAASETFNQKNIGATFAQSLERFRPIFPRAAAARIRVRLYVSCVIACPFEGAIQPDAVRRACDKLLLAAREGGCPDAELDLGDTIGAATPHSTEALLRMFDERERATLTLHLHDTFGHATDCVRAALQLGVRSFDGSAGGLGGCPYASTPGKRAPGNISTLALVNAVHGAGFTTGVDLELLTEASAIAGEIVAAARAGSNSGGGGGA